MTIRTSISKRDRKRTLTCGAVILQPRYVLNFNGPRGRGRMEWLMDIFAHPGRIPLEGRPA